MEIKKLRKQLDRIEKELEKCRTSTVDDGFGTMRYARKARRWDYYAQEKMKILAKIDEIEKIEEAQP